MPLTLGIAVERRSVHLLAVERQSRRISILFERCQAREEGTSPAQALASLLGSVPDQCWKARLVIALSAADLSCSDCFLLPPGIRGKGAEKLLPALIEARCIGEDLESLALGTLVEEGEVQVLAIGRSFLEELRRSASGFELSAITSVPAALSAVFETISLAQGGERVDCGKLAPGVRWRSRPHDGPDEPGRITLEGLELDLAQAPALSAALVSPERVPNLLEATPEVRHGWIRRLRDPIVNAAAALLLCLAGLGIHYHQLSARERLDLDLIRHAERELGRRFLQSSDLPPGQLLRRVQERVDQAEAPGGASALSALKFWKEIGTQFPDPDAMGLTLESLDLAPDGGRLSARVPTGKDDPLKNASDLEAQLNRSRKLAARGDFEVKDQEVHVRLRMEYRP